MNRIDRLFGILLYLQGKSHVRSHDLASTFEVSQRTIYRDVAALSEVGVPIVALPGEGYTLMEGFYLPPLVFTPSEAIALFLGARMLSIQPAGHLPGDAERALAKIANILPEPTRQYVERLTEIIRFFAPSERFNLDDPRLLILQQSILERRAVHLRYHSYNQNETTERDVEPHELSYSDGSWYVSGYCRLRQDIRNFRLERVEELKLLDETFPIRSIRAVTPEPILVSICFAETIVRWVRERQHYGFQREEPTPKDVVMVYKVESTSEIKPWLLSWGAAAEVLSPQEFRDEIRQEAYKLADMLT
jgi:predicted DNA-binding transcriptional regulator YafY